MKNNFTEPQTKAILKFLQHVDTSNQSGGNAPKYSDVFFYKDTEGNFYSSYTKQGFTAGESFPYLKEEKIEINKSGEKLYLGLLHDEHYLKVLFEKLEIITF